MIVLKPYLPARQRSGIHGCINCACAPWEKMSRFGFYFIFIFLLIKSPSLILFFCFAVFVYIHYRTRWNRRTEEKRLMELQRRPTIFYNDLMYCIYDWYSWLVFFFFFSPNTSWDASTLSPRLCVASSSSDGLCCSCARGGHVTHGRTMRDKSLV